MSERPLVQIEGISKSFIGSSSYDLRRRKRVRHVVKALDEVSLSIQRHETVALVGESGSGKSTLARIVMRLLVPDAGRVLLDGEDLLAMDRKTLTSARRRIQMVFQDPYSSLNPRRSAGAAIAEPARVHGVVGAHGEERFVAELLERVGLGGGMAKRLPRELSGGQRQRLAIARALAVQPEILVADEAVSALDVTIQAQILNLFETLRSELGFTMLFISHQLPVVAHVSDRVAVMYQGRVVEVATPAELFASPAHPYTAGLLEAQPGRQRRGVRAARQRYSDVAAEDLAARGCSYRDRCPLAVAACDEVRPPLAKLDAGGREAACHRPSEIGEPQFSQRGSRESDPAHHADS